MDSTGMNRQSLRASLIFSSILSITGCGWHVHNSAFMPSGMSSINLFSATPYGEFSRDVRNQLRLSGIKVFEKGYIHQDIPSLYLKTLVISRDTTSIYRDGLAAQYQIVLNAEATVLVPGHDIYPIRIVVYRSFMDNPAAALMKSSEQDLLTQEMYNAASKQLIRKVSKALSSPALSSSTEER